MQGDPSAGNRIVQIVEEVSAESAPFAAFPVQLRFCDLDAGFLGRVAPQTVICPLFSTMFDALQVAERLAALGWHGRLYVVAPHLPNPELVRQEVARVAPGIEVEMVERL